MSALAATILEAMENPALFGRWFRAATWATWLVFLKALFGLPMDAEEIELYRQCTGRDEPSPDGVREAWLICGRRAGKSLILALIAVFLATFRDWSPYLAPGERGTVMVIATDRRQARVIFRYVMAFLLKVPALAPLVERETAEAVDLRNGVTIEILAANFRTVRGYTLVAALCDEIAFWRNDESANPDEEIISAIRPAMSTIPGAVLLTASSPYAKRGAQWNAYRRHYGKPSPVLVWKADTRTMNPTVPESIIAEAYEADPASAAAEYGAEFRDDVEAFVSREVVDAVVVPGRFELPRISDTTYHGFVDPSGGSRDSMTLAIAHAEGATAVLDVIRERKPPFSPDAVAEEFAGVLKAYGLASVEGDRYGGEWPRERFQVHGIDYRVADRPKSEIYGALLPLLNGRRAELLDLPRLQAQLCGLERRTARGGRDSIDHGPGSHDDVCNAAGGALVRAAERPHTVDLTGIVFGSLGRGSGFSLGSEGKIVRTDGREDHAW